MSINNVTISGNLSRDIDVTHSSSGSSIGRFGVAVVDGVKNKDTGEWEDYINWVDCVMFGKRVDRLGQYLTKGSKVTVSGKLHYSSWEKDGQKRNKIEVVVNNIDLIFPRKDGAVNKQTVQEELPTYQVPTQQQQPKQDVYDEDIPF